MSVSTAVIVGFISGFLSSGAAIFTANRITTGYWGTCPWSMVFKDRRMWYERWKELDAARGLQKKRSKR